MGTLEAKSEAILEGGPVCVLSISISIDEKTGEIELSFGGSRREKRQKGKSLIAFPDEFIVIDLETTGLDPTFCEIIEFCGIKIRNGFQVDRLETLIKPEEPIGEFITQLTGITDEMLVDAPLPDEAIPAIADFIGDAVLVAHNAHFDINFLYDYFEGYLDKPCTNNFVCTLRLGRRIFPDYNNHKLETICENLGLDIPSHRASTDADAVLKVFNECKKFVVDTVGIDSFVADYYKQNSLKASQIAATTDSFDSGHPLFNKHCVFTGTLSRMTRREAMQLVVNLGGKCQDNMTKSTNYLVLGIQDYSRFADGKKSSKTKKAEELILKGQDLEVISEEVFYDLITQEA